VAEVAAVEGVVPLGGADVAVDAEAFLLVDVVDSVVETGDAGAVEVVAVGVVEGDAREVCVLAE
jgi:hypothetical protein